MKPRSFFFFVGCGGAFIWLTSKDLPPLVASHFGGSGFANGFMPHTVYVGFMLAFVIGLPVVAVALTWLVLGNPKARINVPNRDYWLAPERRAETVSHLRTSLLWFGVLLLSFLCYAHWQVVLANGRQPAKLANSWFIGGLVVFLALMLLWLKALLGHFRQIPKTQGKYGSS
ncbi:MAG: hypothetical protein M0036_20130 [Desulfobacteraceae bacterium]|nr:hypothetical protein [Desulfobacteraceae bacterium]